MNATAVTSAAETAAIDEREPVKLLSRIGSLTFVTNVRFGDNASGKIPDKNFARMFAEYDGEQTALETQIVELQTAIDTFAEDSVRR